jgi:hypothetical protein
MRAKASYPRDLTNLGLDSSTKASTRHYRQIHRRLCYREGFNANLFQAALRVLTLKGIAVG